MRSVAVLQREVEFPRSRQVTSKQESAFESYSLSGGPLDGEVIWLDKLRIGQILSIAYGPTREHLLVLDGETFPRVTVNRSCRPRPKRKAHYAKVSRGTVLTHVPDARLEVMKK